MLLSLEGLERGLNNLLPLRATGEKRPLFCLHHIAGLGLQYWDLVSQLSDQQPVYALQADGLDGQTPPRTSVEDMAAHYAELIRKVQPGGPYLLAGYSFGGVIAYEIAQQLIDSGAEVALLALIDRPIPDSLLRTDREAPDSLDAEWSMGVVRLIESMWGVRVAAPDGELQRFTVEQLLERILNAVQDDGDAKAAAFRSLVQSTGEELLRNIFRVVEANAAASRVYTPRSYPGKITLFRAAELHSGANQGFAAIFPENDLGWRRLAADVTVHELPGDHFSIMAPPIVAALANKLQQALDAASGSG
jgi:thioesterase domain-containing protein